MTIRDLKTELETGRFTENLIILKCNKEDFLATQYINEIASILNTTPIYLKDTQHIPTQDGFFEGNTKELYVVRCDKLTYVGAQDNNHVIIIANTISSELENDLKDIIIDMPKLENWQIKDYAYSNLEGIKEPCIDWLLDNTNYNIYRLQSEIDKLSIFDAKEKNIVFQKMLDDNAFDDITKYTIWDFTNAIVKKDITELNNIYNDISNIEMEPIGLLNTLYQNFRKLVLVWMNRNPIPDNTGLTTKQIYAINKLPRVWDKDQLVSILKFITSLDIKVKTGQLPVEYLRDYMVINIMSM